MASYNGQLFKIAVMSSILFFVVHCETPKNLRNKRLKLLYYTASDDGSHHLTSTKIAAALVRRGHEVTFLLSNSYTKWMKASDASMFKFVVHQSTYTHEDRARNLRELSRIGLGGDLRGIWKASKYFIRQKYLMAGSNFTGVLFDFHLNECNSVLGDNETIRELRQKNFDLLVGDDLSDCHPLLAEMLGIKFVLVGATSIIPSKGGWYGVPKHPAYIPERQAGLTDDMNLWQRIQNTFFFFLHDAARRSTLRKFEKLQVKYNLSSERRMPEMLARAQLWVFCGDFALDFARPLQPNVILLASPMLGLPSREKIPKKQKDFLDTADDGVILFSLGSHVNEMESSQAQMFANGLAKLSQRVIWQFPGSLSDLKLGKNTMLVDWVPQQKLMEHPNTKALLSHGGLNGMYEAAYYGLPMVGIPLFGDQFDNMERAVAKGMALKLDTSTLTEEKVYETVARVVEDPRFRHNAQRISRILRDDPVLPSERAAHWIAHVGKYGGEYLRPRAADLSWIELYLVDVYGFLAAILVLILVLLYLIWKCCLWCVCHRRLSEKLKTN